MLCYIMSMHIMELHSQRSVGKETIRRLNTQLDLYFV